VADDADKPQVAAAAGTPADRTPLADATRTRDPSTASTVPSTDEAPDDAPMLFGDPERYQILHEHGRGGLGRVWRAYDRGLGRDVAIKELLSRGPVHEVRFLREALITARLEHPGIVPVHEAGRWPDGTPFYAMKLVSGRPLRDLIAERATVDERITLLHHVIAVADAIAYAHGKNIIHRDLKPANVIVGEFGETIVIDWGLAKDLTAPDDPATGGSIPTSSGDGLTGTGAVLGTPAYMAPEQERGESVDQRADVYAIGALLWELCSLQKLPPSEARARHHLLHDAGIDQDLIAILDKAMERDPARRYRDAGPLAADLKAFKSGARITARHYSLPAMLAHWARRHHALALSALAFVVLLVGSVAALAMLYRSSNRNAADAQGRLIQSYVEQGRRLLLDGEYLRALPYLAEAYARGDQSTAVRFLLARAERLAGSQRSVQLHTGAARDAAFRPDGRHVLSVSDDGSAKLWESDTGREVAALPGLAGGRHLGRVSRDGAFVVIAVPTGVTSWDGVSAHTLATGRADRVALDASGGRVAVAAGGTISAWKLATGERMWVTEMPCTPTQLMWAGDSVVTLGTDNVARIHDGDHVTAVPASGSVYAVFAGSRQIVTICQTSLALWDTAGTLRSTIGGRDKLTTAAISPDGTLLAVAIDTGVVRLYETKTGEQRGELIGHQGAVDAIEFTEDGARIATAGKDLKVRVWDVVTMRLVTSLLGARSTFVPAGLRFDASGGRLVAPSQDGAFRVFATSDPDVALSVDGGEDTELGQYVSNGQRFATSSLRALRMWSSATGHLLAQVDVPAGWRAVSSPDGTKVARFNPDRSDVEILELETGTLLGHGQASALVACARFDHASTRLVTGNTDGVVELWTASARHLQTLKANGRAVSSVTFSPDDRRVASAGADKVARVWDLMSGQELGSLAHTAWISSVEFDASGRLLLTSSLDRIARVWDATSFTLLRSLEHAGPLVSTTMSADGGLLAGAMRDGTVALWHAADSSLLAQLHHAAPAQSVAFSPTGGSLLSTSEDHRGLVWRIDLETRPPEVVAAFVRCHAPYRLVDTRLESAATDCRAP